MKKIMFNDKYLLTKAVLEKRKTQTRRIFDDMIIRIYYDWLEEVQAIAVPEGTTYESLESYLIKNSKYQVGETVAVAQKYSEIYNTDPSIIFNKNTKAWNNKMFVSATLMPNKIEITNHRIQRLQDISDEDCIAEGITPVQQEGLTKERGYIAHYKHGLYAMAYTNVRDAYAHLIDLTCGKGTWDANPYVAVYDFKLLEKKGE